MQRNVFTAGLQNITGLYIMANYEVTNTEFKYNKKLKHCWYMNRKKYL